MNVCQEGMKKSTVTQLIDYTKSSLLYWVTEMALILIWFNFCSLDSFQTHSKWYTLQGMLIVKKRKEIECYLDEF